MAHAGGRPTLYSPQLVDKICALLAQGKSLFTISKMPDMPGLTAYFEWMRKYPEFAKRYADAKQESADALVEEILDIADDGRNDWMESNDPNNPGYKLNNEYYQRSRLRVDTRKWYASKLKPKKYGDKLDVTSQGEKLESLVIVKNGS